MRRIRRIANLGLLVHGPHNAALVNTVSIGNLGFAVEAPAHYRLEMAPVRFDANALRGRSEPLGMIIMGPVTVDADVTVEDIEQGIERLFIMGPVICPDNLVASLRSKTKQQMGLFETYPAGAKLVTISGSLKLDHDALAALEDHTALRVRHLIVPNALPRDLLTLKIQWLSISGRVLCYEDDAPLLRSLRPGRTGKFTVLPAEFKLIERSLTIDSTFLRFSAAPKMYVDGRVTVDPAVTAEEIDRNLQELRCAGMIVAPASLRDSLAPRCDLERDRVLFYDGTPWLEQGSTELTAERFRYVDGVATLIVEGELTIHDAVAPEVLAEGLAKVHNFGTIHCTPAQMGALQARMDRSEGALVDTTAAEDEEEASPGIGNIAFLAL